MKKLTAILLSIIIALSSGLILVSADDHTVDMDVNGSFSGFIIDNKIGLYFPDYLLINSKGRYSFSLSGLDSLSYAEFTVEYDTDILEFVQFENYMVAVPAMLGYVPDTTPHTTAEVIEDGKVLVKMVSDETVKDDYFFAALIFNVIGKGDPDVSVEVSKVTDCLGREYDVNVKTDNAPVNTYYEDEIPTVSLDFEKGVFRGKTSDHTMELGYPMTVGEYLETYDGGGCEVEIENVDGEILGNDDILTTDCKLTATFDGYTISETRFVLIGDVNSDGEINAADARRLLRRMADIPDEEPLSECQRIAANTAKNTDKLTAADAREILRFSAGIGYTYEEWFEYHCILRRSDRFLLNDNLR